MIKKGKGKLRGFALAALLIVPSFFFLFLLVFGENTYVLPTLGAQGVDAQGDTIYLTVTLPGDAGVAARVYTAFEAGLPYNEQRDAMRALSRFQASFKDQKELRLLTLIVDSLTAFERDSLLATLQDQFEPNERWAFLAADTMGHRLVWKAALEAFQPELVGNPNAALLVDRKSRVRGAYDLGKGKENDRLQTEIRVLLTIDADQN